MNDKIKSAPPARAFGFMFDMLRPGPPGLPIALAPCLNCFGATILLLATLSFAASGQSTNSSLRPDYSAFKIVNERNIFNPHRYARSSRVRETRPTSKADSFALVGTMSYEKGAFAFFDGSKSEFRKVVKPAEAIAGYTVTDIAPNSVRLAAGTNEIELKIGNQMRREEEGEWRLGGRQETLAGTSTVSAGSRRTTEKRTAQGEPPPETANTESQALVSDTPTQGDLVDVPADVTSTNASSSETDDPVLRRLMQRREQEINR
jgi:hypothetical protein